MLLMRSFLLSLVVFAIAARAEDKTSFRFSFVGAASDAMQVPADMAYTSERGYGFDFNTHPAEGKPFFFSVRLPEGNYAVTVTLGDSAGESDTTVKAESRRLMLQSVRTAKGKLETHTFVVNVRRPEIVGGGRVKLKEREQGYLHWDDKLTLEFSGPRPAVVGVEVRPAAPETITIYLAGDSTVTDQPREPYNSWGQMLPRFFKSTVAVANHAESGESLKSFTGAKRIDKIFSTIKAGDYLFIQFGHNDQKDKSAGAGAFTTYTDSLKRYVAEARKRQAIAVLVTPVSRRSFGEGGKIVNNLGDFPDAVRQVAKEENVPLIDLNAMSRRFYEAMGPEASARAFAPGDKTHHDNYGSYDLAKCVVEGIRQGKLDLARHLADDIAAFDPSRPDPIEAFDVPASPQSTNTKPEGN